MKKAFLLTLSAALLVCGIALGNEDSPLNHRMKQRQKAQTNNTGKPNCNSLPAREKQFAMKLSPMHRSMFCNQFTAEERAEAMALVSIHKGHKGGKAMTPDEAVEEVMKNHRGAGKRKQPDSHYYGTKPTNSPRSGKTTN